MGTLLTNDFVFWAALIYLTLCVEKWLKEVGDGRYR